MFCKNLKKQICIYQLIYLTRIESFVISVDEEKIIETIEGKTRLLVPALSLIKKDPPKSPAFFNPLAKLTRDISILAYRAFLQNIGKNKKIFGDSFSGLGARALRVAVEVPEIEEVYINDINPLAIDLSRKAAELNFVLEKCNFSVNDVCKFLITHPTKTGNRFGIVDLDPFGSPARYIDCVLRSVLDSGLISITATDTAVLCGIYNDVCLRKYYGTPINNYYTNETAIRLMTSLIALTAARLNLGIYPLFAHSYIHYLRIYLKVTSSSSQANKVFDNIGYLQHCFRCGNRNVIKEYTKSEACELCGNSFSLGGKLWVSKLFDRNFIKKMANYCDFTSICSDNKNPGYIRRILSTSINEIDDIPHYFRTDEIASKLKTNPQSLQKVIEKLSAAGYRASKTSLNPNAFKTDAKIDQILNLLQR